MFKGAQSLLRHLMKKFKRTCNLSNWISFYYVGIGIGYWYCVVDWCKYIWLLVNHSCRFFVWVDPPLEGATLEEESKENSEIQVGCHEELMKIQVAKHDAIREIDAMKYEALHQVEKENTAKKYEVLLQDEIDKCKTLFVEVEVEVSFIKVMGVFCICV